MRTITPERIFVATTEAQSNRPGYFTRVRRGQLVNDVQTAKWTCSHNHTSREVATRCAERERRRWVRTGKAPR